jgi:histidine triad (HIT) family protein
VEDLQAAIATAQRVAQAIREGLKPDGLNMLQANGVAAFQSVLHFHLHLIPRWTGDGKGFDWKLVPGHREQIMKVGERIRALLN